MRAWNTTRFVTLALAWLAGTASNQGLWAAAGVGLGQNASLEECAWTSKAQIYSSAYHVEEAGDVVGEELALQVHDGKSVEARLYDYEGVPNTDGIRLTGRISGQKVKLQGDWVQRTTEQPSNKQTEQTWHVEVSGTVDGKQFRGTIKISGMAKHVSMHHVNHIWMCEAAK